MKILVPLAFAVGLAAQDPAEVIPWPDFRGPTWDGQIDAELPLNWSEKENVRWKTAIRGEGWSSPVVGENRVWLTTATDRGKKLHAVAVDLQTGEVVHERVVFSVPKPKHKNRLNSFASPSPVLEAGRVYLHFGTHGTACLDTRTAKTLWQRRDIECDHMEGAGSSPVLYKGLLVFNVDGGDVQYVIALDKKTGKTKWLTERTVDFSKLAPDLRKAYSTPIIIQVEGEDRLISSGARATMAYDPLTGKELWKMRHIGFSMSSRPLHANGVLYLNTGYMRPRLLAVDVSGEGDVTEAALLWSYRRGVPTMPSGLLVEGRYYMVSDTGIASCVDLESGERVWYQRLNGEYSASPVCTGGRIYFFDRDGRTQVIAPGGEFKRLASNQLEGGFMSSPAVAGSALILRSKTHLYRVEAD